MGRKPMPIVVEIIGAHPGADGLDAVIVSGPATLIGRRVLVRGEDVAEVLIETTPDDDLEAAEELASIPGHLSNLVDKEWTDWEDDDQDDLYKDA